MNAISTLTTVSLEPATVPAIATINWQTIMPTAPQTRRGLRPKRSTVQKEIGVEHTLTKVVMSEMRKGLEMVPIYGQSMFDMGTFEQGDSNAGLT